MDNVTQQNAALVEEASAASKSMEQQSATLVSQIGYFRSSDGRAIVRDVPAHAEVQRPAPRVAARTPSRATTKPRSVATAQKSASAPAHLARASGDDSVWQEF
jgi:methyl-accepting chemotaxis protein